MNKNKHLLTALFLAGTLLTTTSCGNVLPANTLVVGLECDYAPFNWTQTSPSDYALPIQGIQGQYADGYDVQIARYIAKDLNYDIQIKKIEWDSLISSLR
ncbi:MAG: hypothetical protein HUJ61_03945, partial [Bacilli bacterium]|nr:hypothetical protein [Bacilli bacterium]